jgi:uncharacterized protein (DUF433 family)
MTGPVAYFSVDQTAELTDLNPGLLRRWDTAGVFHPAQSTADTKRPLSRLYSFQDVIVLRTLAQAREAGVSSYELRKIAKFVEEHPETSWSETRIYVVGHKVYFSYTDAARERLLLSSNPLGQQAMPSILTIDLGQVHVDAERRLQQMIDRSPDQIGQTEQNRFVVGGAEVFAGTRIPVLTVIELLEAGWSYGELLENFPRLMAADLDAVKPRLQSARSLLAG